MVQSNVKQAKAVCKSIRTSSRKLNLVAQTIRGLNVEKAVAELSFSKKRIAKVVLDLKTTISLTLISLLLLRLIPAMVL